MPGNGRAGLHQNRNRFGFRNARACRDHLRIEIPIEEDPSMIDDLGPVSEEAVDRFVAAKEASPGYEGYRARGEAFRASR